MMKRRYENSSKRRRRVLAVSHGEIEPRKKEGQLFLGLKINLTISVCKSDDVSFW